MVGRAVMQMINANKNAPHAPSLTEALWTLLKVTYEKLEGLPQFAELLRLVTSPSLALSAIPFF